MCYTKKEAGTQAWLDHVRGRLMIAQGPCSHYNFLKLWLIDLLACIHVVSRWRYYDIKANIFVIQLFNDVRFGLWSVLGISISGADRYLQREVLPGYISGTLEAVSVNMTKDIRANRAVSRHWSPQGGELPSHYTVNLPTRWQRDDGHSAWWHV